MRATAGRAEERLAGIAAALLCFGTIVARWPGVAMYDTVAQYGQIVDGEYTDWHPPIMARLWSVLIRVHPGLEPFFALQALLWWGGLGLLAGGLAHRGRRLAAACVLMVGAAPLFLGWATVILKDAQMACCLVAAVGLVAHWRLRERAIPIWGAGLALLLIGYATLVRGNAVFGTVPLAFALFDWAGVRRWPARAALVVAVVLALIGVEPVINHRLLGAEATQVERSLPLYDMAGIAHHAHLPTIAGLPPALWGKSERLGCYSPYYWNPYGEPALCDDVGQAAMFAEAAPPRPMARWAGMVARHPLAYMEHRAVHLNSNLRFWVGPGEGDAIPPAASQPNDLGLGAPARPPGAALSVVARWMSLTPLGWPCVWLALSLALLWAARGAEAQVRIGRALAFSAACMSGSFAVVSIASDLRYHLWSMLAAALALVLLIDARALDGRRGRVAGIGVLLVALVASAAHLGFAPPVHAPVPRVTPPPAAG